MAENDSPKVVGMARSYMTPAGYTQRPAVKKSICDHNVPPAADSIIGRCEYYYRPLHCAYAEKVEKLPSINEVVAWAQQSFDPWAENDVSVRLLGKRDQLIPPECTDSDWSRHSNFMMRHIGCSHKPPSYYLSYGYYYCSNYGAKLKPSLSDSGKDLLDSARWWLQKNLEKGLAQNMRGDGIKMRSLKPGNGSFAVTDVKKYQLELDDSAFLTFAFNTHPLAYLDAGLADLPFSDLAKIAGQPSIQEWGDRRTWGQAMDSGLVVGKNWVNQALSRLMAK